MTTNDGPVLTEDGLKRLYEELDETDQGSLWVELLHMERNGFDIARQKNYILTVFEDAVREQGLGPEQLSDDQQREIALQVRRQLRRELNMPPLTPEEEAAWEYKVPPWFHYPHCHGPDRAFDAADIRRVIDWIATNDPMLIDYIRSVTAHNRPLGFNGGPNDRLIIRASWAGTSIMAIAAKVFGDDCPHNIFSIWRDIWDEIAKGENPCSMVP